LRHEATVYLTWGTMTQAYTLATYRVIPGKEDDFVAAWTALTVTFASLDNRPYRGTLIQSTRDRTLFHSFGPWERAEHIAAMRSSPDATAAFEAINALCVEMLTDDYEVVRHVEVREE
jgi:quinol monooxygenase YgiN